jgi:predicted AlkP superfamily phosphohydrolase/phosphomutase
MRLLIIGLDGTDFDVLQPLLDRGALPNLARLIAGGSKGQLRSTFPPMSPPAWTTFMTGKNPGKHGVFDFTMRRQGAYDVEFTNARFRKATTVFRLMSDAGKRVCVLSIPMTFPPERLNGIQISGFDTPGVAGGLAEPSGMQPPELHAELSAKLGGYIVSPELSGLESPDDYVKEAYRTVDRKIATAEYLYAKEPWDCFMVTLGETDALSHRLWQYHDRKSPLGDEASRAYPGESPLDRIYTHIDAGLGRLLASVREDTTIFVLSDHGHAGNSDRAIYLNRFLAGLGLLRLDASPHRRAAAAALSLAKKLGTRNIVPSKYRQKAHRAGLAGRIESWLRFGRIDWKRTRAYSEETPYYPAIWLNVEGREPQGTVKRGEEYDRVMEQIVSALREWKDPDTGRPVVLRTHRREDVFHGPYVDRVPDLIVEWAMDGNYSYLFRPSQPGDSQKPTVARIPDAERRTVKSGDHRDYGMLIAHGDAVTPGEMRGAEIQDMAPTFLHLLGLPVPSDMDGKVLTGFLKKDFVHSHPVAEAVDAAPLNGTADVQGEYSEEEQEAVRKRLQGLGYME